MEPLCTVTGGNEVRNLSAIGLGGLIFSAVCSDQGFCKEVPGLHCICVQRSRRRPALVAPPSECLCTKLKAALISILAWMYANRHGGIIFRRALDFDPGDCLAVFMDADLVRDVETRRSRSGKLIMICRLYA